MPLKIFLKQFLESDDLFKRKAAEMIVELGSNGTLSGIDAAEAWLNALHLYVSIESMKESQGSDKKFYSHKVSDN